jgi:hypothetical protein
VPSLRSADRSGADTSVRLAIPPESGLVRFVRLVSVALARINSVSDEVIDDVRLATGEACSRAVAAHRIAGIDAPVVVEVKGGKSLSVTVRDQQVLPAATGMQAADLLRKAVVSAGAPAGGTRVARGAWLSDGADDDSALPEAIGLIVGLADDVVVETGPQGTSVTMTWATAGR